MLKFVVETAYDSYS